MDFLLVLKYTLLGMFQGFTEPIPISSSGHLVIAQELMGLKIEGLNFELFVNFASLLAVLLIYREDLIRLTVNGWRYLTTRAEDTKEDFKFILYLLLASVPAGVIGVVFGDVIEDVFKGTATIGWALLVTGLALWLIRNLRGRKNDGELTTLDAIIIGCAQAIALIPGISRSGATIVAAMGRGTKASTALRFSFLLYIPVSLGGMLLGAKDLINDPSFNTMLIPYLFAFVAAFVMSYFSLKWFQGIMERGNLKYFSIYCFIVGTLVILFL
ncbi:MAG: undecaprenyl-diphosphate phosphatase [Bacillaceae bacterium]